MSRAMDYIEENRQRFVEDLRALIRIPSVSAQPAHQPDMQRCAEWLRDHLAGLGLTAEIHPTGGHPLVTAEWLRAPGKPTLLVYGHYDVQPPEPLDLWKHPPFEAAIEGKLLIARGASDDKGQFFAWVKAIESCLRTDGSLSINVKLLIEGEEEVGSEHLGAWVASHRDKLRCDALAISDGSQFAPGLPAITYGLRGLAYLEVRVHGPDRDLHSGSYGGGLANPANVLCDLISGLMNDEGRIQIEGFYDKVRPLTLAEQQEFARLPFDDHEFCRSTGIDRTWGEAGFTTLERRWARPTCDVNGLFGGYQGEGAKTVLPAWAGAKVSFRLVPDQEPREIARLFRRHIESHAPSTVRVEVIDLHGGHPVIVPIDSPQMQAAKRALTRGFGREPAFIREGGSIPIVHTFQQELQAPVMLLGFGLSDDNAHSPNEQFDLDDYHRGIRTAAFLFEELAG